MSSEYKQSDWNLDALESYEGNIFDVLPLSKHDYVPALREHFGLPERAFSDEELNSLLKFAMASGIRPEGSRRFALDNYRYLIPLYEQLRENPFRRMVIQKAAQTGLTILMLLDAMWWTSDTEKANNVALLFPSAKAVSELSAARFRPMINSSSKLMGLIKEVNRVELVRVAISNMYFRGMRSGIAMDSVPLDVLEFDEVRLMSIQSIERTLIRITESSIIDPVTGERGIVRLNSTAGFPLMDINRWFERESTKGYFASRCPDLGCVNSKNGIILSQEWLANHRRIIGQRLDGSYYLRCPKCGARISDPQDGFYIHENPKAQWKGFQFSQLLKSESFLNRELMPAFKRGDNMPEFINSRIGMAYEDTDAIPASEAVVLANRDSAGLYHAPLEPLGFGFEFRAVGIDQRAGELHVVIKTLMPDGRHRLDHFCIIEETGKKASARAIHTILAWGCKIAIIDGEPSYHLFVDIADGLKGSPCTVYQQDYVDGIGTSIVRFEDKRSDKTTKKNTGAPKYPKRALLSRYHAIDWSLNLFALVRNILPVDIYSVMQVRNIGGTKQNTELGKHFVEHMRNIARVKMPTYKTDVATGEKFEVVGEHKLAFRNLSFDPHFVHANLYADIGLRWAYGKAEVFTAGDKDEPLYTESGFPTALDPKSLTAKERASRKGRVCGTCLFFKDGLCTNEKFTLGARVRTQENAPICKKPSGRSSFYKPDPNKIFNA